LLLVALVTAASLDDGTTASRVLLRLTADQASRLELVRGDWKYRDDTLDRRMAREWVEYAIEVINRPKDAEGFVLLPKPWVVKRSFAWLGRYRRQSRDYEWKVESSEAMIKVSAIRGMLRRLDPKSAKANPFNYPKRPQLVAG
jgi:putative transposase